MNLAKFTLSLAALCLMAGAAHAATYRWVDEQGRVHYSDVIPPQQAGRGNVELDRQGRIRKENPRTVLSPEERRRQEAAAGQAEASKRQEQAQRRRDRSLLSTYVSEAEIDLARDRALAQEASTLNGLKVRLKAAGDKLDYANGKLAPHRSAGTAGPKAFVQMRDEATAEQAQLGELIRKREQSMEQTRARFDADKQRFRELRAVSR